MPTLLSCLPQRIARCVSYYEAQGYAVEEIRLHREEKILLVSESGNLLTGLTCTEQEFEQTLLALCEDSLYAHAETIKRGYISVRGGYRVGVCGNAVGDDTVLRGISQITGLNLRLPHEIRGVCDPLYRRLKQQDFQISVLVFAAPGVGKTTLLRDLARRLATPPDLRRVCVVDSRRELGYGALTQGTSIDLLSGYPKAQGMEIAVRTLSPEYVICDEIGNDADVAAIEGLLHAGVRIAAAAHASDLHRLLLRPAFARLHQKRAFDLYCHIQKDNGKRRLTLTDWEVVG